MNSFLRPYRHLGVALLALTAVAAAPPGAIAQPGISHIIQELKPLLSHPGPGYLGVLVTDVDNDSVQKLKLKDTHGALVTLIDHDAPAGSSLHVNDVVVSVNGESVQGAEQFGRMLKEIPAGKKVSLDLMRDGAQQTITVQLVDRKAMEQDVWNKVNSGSFPPPPSGMGILTGGGDGVTGWHMPLFTSSLNVGALVEPLTAQMAEYLGIPAGIMVKQVARKSEAANAGLKPFDVILKVGTDPVKTSADWDRALRANQGKPVQVTVLRDRKQQVITLQVDSKHHSRAEWTDMFPDPDCPQIAMLDESFMPEAMEQLMQGTQELAEQFNNGKFPSPQIDPKAMEELRKEMDQFRQNFKPEDFKPDPKAMEELRQQMEQFQQSFNIDDFKIDPKQMEELNRQMDQFRKEFQQNFHFDRHQLDELQRELQDFQFGQHV